MSLFFSLCEQILKIPVLKYISKEYNGAKIEIKNKRMYITATSVNMRMHNKPNTDVLREISHYAMNVQPVNSVKITIKNRTVDSTQKRQIDQIKHSISLEYHQWSSSTTYTDGSVYDTKSVYLSY